MLITKKQFLRKGAIVFMLVFLMSNFLPAFANETQTGTMLTNSGVLVELENINPSSTGEIILEENELITNSGSLSLTESETGSSTSGLEEVGTGEVLTESEGREKAMEEITAEDEYTEILIKYRDDKINVLKNPVTSSI